MLKKLKKKIHTLKYFFKKKIHPNSLWQARKFKSYEDYVALQKKKTTDPERRKIWLGDEWKTKIDLFYNKFNEIISEYDFKPSKGICLGARVGQEVVALQKLDFDAIGVDLVENLPYVVRGDIHNLKFENNTFGFAFTNIYDHSLYPEKFSKEINRILKKNGVAVIHLSIDKPTDEFGVIEMKNEKFILDKFRNYEILKNSRISNFFGCNHEIIVKKIKDI